MKLNFPKNIVDQIEEAISEAKRMPESVTLDRAERHELYKNAGGRFRKTRFYTRPEARGWLALTGGGSVLILAAEDL